MYNQLVESLLEIESFPGTYFGISEAGWIHPGGQIEDLPDYCAGDHDKDAFEKLNPGQKWEDSDDIGDAYKEYLKQGHIRYIQSSRGLNIELIAKPTDSQMRAISKGIKEGTGEFYFSIRTLLYLSDGDSWKEFREETAKL